MQLTLNLPWEVVSGLPKRSDAAVVQRSSSVSEFHLCNHGLSPLISLKKQDPALALLPGMCVHLNTKLLDSQQPLSQITNNCENNQILVASFLYWSNHQVHPVDLALTVFVP